MLSALPITASSDSTVHTASAYQATRLCLVIAGSCFWRCFQDKNVTVYINHDSINLYHIWSMLLWFGMSNVVPQGVIWWEPSAGSIPFQLTTEVFANQRLGLSAFAGEIMLESFEKKKLRQQKALRKMANDFTSCGTHWDRSYLRWRRDETASFLWSKHCSSFFKRSDPLWLFAEQSILRTINLEHTEDNWFILILCK